MRDSLLLFKAPNDLMLSLMKMTCWAGPTLSLVSSFKQPGILRGASLLLAHILQCSWGLAAPWWAEASVGLLMEAPVGCIERLKASEHRQ